MLVKNDSNNGNKYKFRDLIIQEKKLKEIQISFQECQLIRIDLNQCFKRTAKHSISLHLMRLTDLYSIRNSIKRVSLIIYYYKY
jgi:hypothetical protein